ncbi:MAG: GIY-YIG nuclease family protein [Gammaproteobacteria bacterium AqS3]|nr:GIY-YIG nuclease family protein [Gammaproteobacteria bacterium AqS3]
MSHDFPKVTTSKPKIYAYSDTHPDSKGLLKIGYTTRDVKSRVREQYPTARPGKLPYKIVLEASAMRDDGTTFTDRDVHRCLRGNGINNPGGEWFECTVGQVKNAVLRVRNGINTGNGRSQDFKMRPEQKEAVDRTAAYFEKIALEKDLTPRFLWNAKMRFGKTFAAYQLAKRMDWKKVLVLTFKPAVQSAWEEDLMTHTDFSGWQFVTAKNAAQSGVDISKPIICFGSFQDFMGRNKQGGIKSKNEWVHATNWNCVVFDEYHYGAWRESAQELFEAEDPKERRQAKGEGISYFDEEIMPITTDFYLYLSGTPFRALTSGEFIEEQIYNWTYSDEQRAKKDWRKEGNPYASLPRMVMMTYQLPEAITQIAMEGEFDHFDLNEFFSATGEKQNARFKYEDEVQKWLDLIRGSMIETAGDNLQLATEKPPMPFSHAPLLSLLNHTFWFLPSVASCYAMKNLINQRQNTFYRDYQVIVAAGAEAGLGVKALSPVKKALGNPLESKTITLSCGKLTTGVSVKPWTGIFMLRNIISPETYFQAAFRVQTAWEIENPDGQSPNEKEIIKRECYVFDFAPNRALRQIADYSCRLNVSEDNPEEKVAEFIEFLPVLAYDGSSMKQIDASGVLDMAMSGTTATLLARRWESALLVNVDNFTLRQIMDNPDALQALMKIEGFRNLNRDIETIINQSDSVKSMKKDANNRDLTEEERTQLSKEERELKKLRRTIQEKLIKFATRVPVFMYLTDYREQTLKEIIERLEPDLFEKVTGLTLGDFKLLVDLGVFNSALMNDAVYKFKRYEDASLSYTGISKHEGTNIGLYDTVVSD